MTREEHVETELERLLRAHASRTAPIGALVFLLIAPLDFVSAPEQALSFLACRAAAAAGLLLVWRMAARVRSPIALRAWLLAGVVTSAVTIEFMILRLRGESDAYNDGMVLLAVAVLGAIPASAAFHALLGGSVFAIFCAPVLLQGAALPGIPLTKAYLFLAIIAVTILLRHLHRASLKREIGLAFDLAVKERGLEAQIAERTAELVRSAQEWRAAFDATDDLMLLIDSEGRIVKVNLATALLSRKDPRSLIGSQAATLLHRVGLERGLGPLETVQRSGARATVEFRHDGSGRWLLATAEPIPQGRAQAGGAVLSMRDISGIKVMEQAVAQARDEWEKTFDSIKEGITIHDENFVVLRANAAARRLLGRGDEPLEGIKCHKLFHGLECPVGGCPGQQTLRSGWATTVDLYEPHLNRYLEITTLPRAGGGITHVVHDISERKQAMDELSRAAGRLQGILERAPFGVFIVNEQFRVEFANPAMIAISGYPREKFVGEFLGNFPGCAELGIATHVQGALEGSPFRFGPAGYHCLGGRKVVGQFTGIPVEEDGLRKAVVFVEDVTSLANAEDERLRLNALLLQAQKMESIGTLASGIAHDFNNILLAVIGMTDAAAEQLEEGHFARPQLEAVIVAAERGSELVQQLLAFGRKQELRMRRIDLSRLVEETRAMLVHVIPKHIAIAVHDRGQAPPVVADPAQIGQVLMNLAVNARDAMPDGGSLTIETAMAEVAADDPAHPGVTPGSYALIAVLDTGTGMPAEVREKIFDPFFTTKAQGQGTGLGLATVYGIISQHGGTVRVESAPGAGAAFFVYLPAAPGGEAAEATPVPRGAETILLVEDDALVRQLIGRKLLELGYQVLEAADGESALRLLETDGALPDLLLCDIALPGIGARQVAAVARARLARVHVVYLSSHPESQLAQSGLLEPGDLLLSRSFGPEEIARRLRGVLDNAAR